MNNYYYGLVCVLSFLQSTAGQRFGLGDTTSRRKECTATEWFYCILSPCYFKTCYAFPNAICSVSTDKCGSCKPVWTINGQIVDCDKPKCPLGIREMNCPLTLCRDPFCPDYPSAVCTPDVCGHCGEDYFLNGLKVDCFQSFRQQLRQMRPDVHDRAIQSVNPAGLNDTPFGSTNPNVPPRQIPTGSPGPSVSMRQPIPNQNTNINIRNSIIGNSSPVIPSNGPVLDIPSIQQSRNVNVPRQMPTDLSGPSVSIIQPNQNANLGNGSPIPVSNAPVLDMPSIQQSPFTSNSNNPSIDISGNPVFADNNGPLGNNFASFGPAEQVPLSGVVDLTNVNSPNNGLQQNQPVFDQIFDSQTTDPAMDILQQNSELITSQLNSGSNAPVGATNNFPNNLQTGVLEQPRRVDTNNFADFGFDISQAGVSSNSGGPMSAPNVGLQSQPLEPPPAGAFDLFGFTDLGPANPPVVDARNSGDAITANLGIQNSPIPGTSSVVDTGLTAVNVGGQTNNVLDPQVSATGPLTGSVPIPQSNSLPNSPREPSIFDAFDFGPEASVPSPTINIPASSAPVNMGPNSQSNSPQNIAQEPNIFDSFDFGPAAVPANTQDLALPAVIEAPTSGTLVQQVPVNTALNSPVASIVPPQQSPLNTARNSPVNTVASQLPSQQAPLNTALNSPVPVDSPVHHVRDTRLPIASIAPQLPGLAASDRQQAPVQTGSGNAPFQAVSCLKGVLKPNCTESPCAGQTCHIPGAQCFESNCGSCHAEWYLDGRMVDCSPACAPGEVEAVCTNPCTYLTCPAHPTAICRESKCRACTTAYYVNNQPVDCDIPSDPCPPDNKPQGCTCFSKLCPLDVHARCRIVGCGNKCEIQYYKIGPNGFTTVSCGWFGRKRG